MTQLELDPDDIVAAAAEAARAIEVRTEAPYACHHELFSAAALDAVISPETSVYLAVLDLRAKVDAFLSAKELCHRGPGFLVLTWAQPACSVDRVEPETAAQDSEPNR